MNWTLAGGGPGEKEEEGDCDRTVTGRTKACAGGEDQGGVIIWAR